MDSSFINKVIGDFLIKREIARGGQGIVFEAEEIELKRQVALKVLHRDPRTTQRTIEQFRKEAEIAAGLEHPNIVPVYSFGEELGYYYFAMKLIEGASLSDAIEEMNRRLQKEGGQEDSPPADTEIATITPEQEVMFCAMNIIVPKERLISREAFDPALFDKEYCKRSAALIKDIANALHYAHERRIIHRDIKPQNIMIDQDGVPSVTDFGLAIDIEGTMVSITGEFAGTPHYMSPEQIAAGRIGIDGRTDIYSLGVTLYELLTLARPFDGETTQQILRQIEFKDPEPPRNLNEAISRDLEVVTLKAMEKDPDNRYQTARDFADDLESYLKDEPIKARPPGIIRLGAKKVKKHKILAAAIAATILGIILAWGCIALAQRLYRKWDARARISHVRESLKENRPAEAAGAARAIIAKYTQRPEVEEASIKLGEALLKLEDEKRRKTPEEYREESLETFIKAYITSEDDAWQAWALYHLGNYFLEKEDFERARSQYEKVIARYPSTDAVVQAKFKLAQACIQLKDLEKALSLLQSILNDRRLSEEDRKSASEDILWLTSFSPLVRMQINADEVGALIDLEIGDIDSDGSDEIVLASTRKILILKQIEKRLKLLAECQATEKGGVVAICLGDIDNDSRTEIVALEQREETKVEQNIRAYKYQGRTLNPLPEFKIRTGAVGGPDGIAVGNVDDDVENEIVFADSGSYNRISLVYDRSGANEYSCFYLDQENENRLIDVVRIADVDADGLNEIIMGSREYTGYDVRVAKFNKQERTYDRVWRKRLGRIQALDTGDIDGDGISEIVAAKSDTTNSVVFGEDNPHGSPNGVYVFKHQSDNNYTLSSSYPLHGERSVRPGSQQVLVGDLNNDGKSEFIVSWGYDAEGVKRTHWIDIYEHAPAERFKQRRLFYRNSVRTVRCGDVDGDGDIELLVKHGNYVDVYGINVPLEEDPTNFRKVTKSSPRVKTSKDLPTIAQDLCEMGFFEDAYKLFAKLPLEERLDAWFGGMQKCYEEAERYSQALEILEGLQREIKSKGRREIEIDFSMLDLLKRTTEQDRWKRAFAILERLKKRGRLSDDENNKVDEYLGWITPLAKSERHLIFSEDFSNKLSHNWTITNPLKVSLDEGRLHVLQSRLSEDFAQIYLPWNGGSFELCFRMLIKDIDWDSYAVFGIIGDKGEDPDKVSFGFSRSGASDDEIGVGAPARYDVWVSFVADAKRKQPFESSTKESFKPSTSYMVRARYVEDIGELYVTFEDLIMHRPIATFLYRDARLRKGNYYLGVLPSVGDVKLAGGTVNYLVSDVKFYQFGAKGPVRRREQTPGDEDEKDKLMRKANLELVNKEFDKAVAGYSKLIKLAPNLADAYYFRGAAHKGNRDLIRAFQDYKKALDLKSDLAFLAEIHETHPSLDGLLAKEYLSQEEYRALLNRCAQRIEADADKADAYFTRGLVYYFQKRYVEALSDFQKCIELDNANVKPHIYAGNCHLALLEGQSEAVRKRLSTMQSGQPRNEIRGLISEIDKMLEKQMENETGAKECFTASINMDKNNDEAWAAEAMFYLASGMFQKAISNLDTAIQLRPEDFSFYFRRGQCHFNMGDFALAIRDFEEAQSLTEYHTLKGYLAKQITLVNERMFAARKE